MSYKITLDNVAREHWRCILTAKKKDDDFFVQARSVQKTKHKHKTKTYLLNRKLISIKRKKPYNSIY